jgi:PAS domain S-box-containing protein
MKLPRIFFPPEFQDPEQNRQSKLLHGFLLFVLLIVTAFAVAITIVFPSNIPRTLYFVGFVVISSLVCFPQIYRGKTRLASYSFIFLFWLLITALSLTGGGTEAPAFVGFLLILLSAGLLLGRAPGLIIGVLCLVTEIVIAYAEANGLLPTGMVQDSFQRRIVADILFFAFVAVFIFFYTKGIESTILSTGSVSKGGSAPHRKIPKTLLTILLIFSIGIIAAGYFYSRYLGEQFEKSAEDDLLNISKLKATQVEDWRRERIGDAQVLSEKVSMSDLLQQYLLHPSDKNLQKEIEQLFESVRESYGYSSIAFFDRKHNLIVQAGEYKPNEAAKDFQASFDSSARSGKILFSDLHKIPGSNNFRLDLFDPVFDHSGKTLIGLIVLQNNPDRALFPLVQNWPVQTRTTESALFRREGAIAVNLSRLRFTTTDSIQWHIPVTNPGLSWSRVLEGSGGILQGVDYRGVPVYAAVQKLANFPWYIIVKEDEAEVNEPLRRNQWSIGVLIAFLILGAGGGVAFLWQSNTSAFYRRQFELESERRLLAQQFEYLTKYANDIILLMDAQNRIVEANERASTAYGYSHEELIGMDARNLRAPNELSKFESDIQKIDVLKGLVFETAHKRKDGTTFPAEISSRSIEVDGKKFLQAIIRDITKRKRAEEEVRQKDAELRFFAEATFEGIFFHQDGRFIKVNDQFAKMVGLGHSELIGQPGSLIIPPESVEMMERHALEKRSDPYEVTLQRKDGSRWPAEIRGQLVIIDGKPSRQVVIRDLTEQKKAEQRLRESEQQLKEAQHIALIGSSRWDAVTDTTFWSDELYRITGWDPSLPAPTNAERAKLYTPESYAVLRLAVARAMETGDPYDLELEIVRTDGELRHVLAKGRAIRDEQNNITGLLGTMQDITERKRSEEMIKEREVQYRELVETARDEIYTLSTQGTFTSVNSAFESVTGWKREEWIGKPFVDVLHPKDGHKMNERFARSMRGEPQPLDEVHIKTKSGKYILVELSTVPQTRNGKVVGVLGIGRDITERKQLEEQLRRTQRLDSIGSLASGIAHDLNNVLGPILLGVDVLIRKVTDEPSKKILLNLRNSGKRGSEIVKQVLAFARGTEQEYSPQQLRYVVNEIHSFVRETFPKEVNLRVDIPKDLPPILGDSTQLHQILLNLCVNARDAMPSGGQIRISASKIDLSKSDVENYAGARPGAFVCLSVSDTGTGIPEEIKAKIFDPFFTTKEVGKGTGLGLSTVTSIVRDHKGILKLVSEVGRGTEFKIYFPAIDQDQMIVEPEVQPVLPRGNGEGVLIVDDEQSVVHIGREILEAYNYKVFTASDGVEATLIYNQEPRGSISVVVTDINMPRMSGVDLAQILRNTDAHVKILLTSGSPAETAARKAQVVTYEFLSKPFTADQLLLAIDKLLHETENGNRNV